LRAAAGCSPLDENRRRINAEKRTYRRADSIRVAADGSGKKVSEIVREMGVSQQAFYSWKRKYAGLGLNELRELRQLRDENRKLRTLVADLTLDKHILQEVLSKKALSPRHAENWCAECGRRIRSAKSVPVG
jgi:putative transposase